MALSQSGLSAQGVIVAPIGGSPGSRKPQRGKKRGTPTVRKGGKQNLFVAPRGRK